MDFAAKSRTPDVHTQKNSKKRKPEIEPEGDIPKKQFEKPTESNDNGPLTSLILSSKSGLVDPEALRQKLQDRIQEMRKIRHADENRKRKEYRLSLEPNLPKKKKQKRTKAAESHAQIDDEDDDDDEDPNPSSTRSTPTKANVSLDETDVKFSTFELDSGKPVPSYLVKKRKPKATKIQVLKETQEKAKLASENPELDKKFAYEAAMKKLKGEKVFSAAVLKKQIKQEKRKKEKSKSQWANRKAEEAEKFKEKQRQRQQNIQEHLDKRKAKKIQKRRKNRPGFEGKKA